MSDKDECPTCTFWQRVGLYALLRLKEPTTWAGFSVLATGLGLKLAPELQAEIGAIGIGIVSVLLMAAREGRSTPDNPSAPATIKGEMPAPNPPIVPPPAPAGSIRPSLPTST